MKKLILSSLFTLSLLSCNHKSDGIIRGKAFIKYNNEDMPKGICRFWTVIDSEHIEFQDSCNCYAILDTMKGFKQKDTIK